MQNPAFWNALSDPQKELIRQGEFLRDIVIKKGRYQFSDYSFMVFPFAKAYEGFLKKIFLEVGFISDADYISDHFRLGKVLSPNLVDKLGRASVYKKISDRAGASLADHIWLTWKRCRNEIFHYFPHNLRSINLTEAEDIIKIILQTIASTSAVLSDNR